MSVLIVQSGDASAFERAVQVARSRWPGATLGALVENSSIVTRLASPLGGPVFLYETSPSGTRPALDLGTIDRLRAERFESCVLSFGDRDGVQYWSFRLVPLKAGISRIMALGADGRVRECGRLFWWVRTFWACGVLRLLQPRLWMPPPVLTAWERSWDATLLVVLALLAVLAGALRRGGLHPLGSARVCTATAPSQLVIFVPNLSLGGAQRALINFLCCVDRQKFRVHICTLKGIDDFFEEDVRALDIPVTYLPCEGQRPFWKIPWALTRFLRIMTPHAVLGWLPWATVFAAMAGSLAGVPRIVMFYRSQSPDQRGGTYPFWLRPLDIIGGRLADVVLANSQASRRDYLAWARVPSAKLVTVYSGVDERDVRPLSKEHIRGVRSELGVGDQPVVGVVGRLTPEKDHDMFFQALRLVRAAVPAVQAVLVGNGSEEPRLRALTYELGLADCVKFLGPRRDALAIIGSLDVLALTSRTEGLPNVLLEAQALEIPVVTTDAGGAPEVVRDGETGYIVPCGDSRRVAERIVSLLQDEALRCRLGAAGRAHVTERFGADRMAGAVLRHCGL